MKHTGYQAAVFCSLFLFVALFLHATSSQYFESLLVPQVEVAVSAEPRFGTFTDEAGHLSFRYQTFPKGLTVAEDYTTNRARSIVLFKKSDQVAMLSQIENPAPLGALSHITVSIYPNPKNLSIEEWMKSDPRSHFGSRIDDPMVISTKNGDALALRFMDIQEGKSTTFGFEDRIYAVSVNFSGTSDPILAQYDLLLDSLVLTN